MMPYPIFMLEAALIGGGGEEGKAEPLNVTKNGIYNAPDNIVGYTPVVVNVSDRYTEGYNKGYQDGYNDGCNDTKNIYDKIIEQINGDGKTVTDDKGNEIPNAITPDNDDDLKKYLQAVSFSSSDGGAVTVQGLGGADTSFTVECVKNYRPDGSVASTGARITAKNLLTGKTISFNGSANLGGDNITFKITNISFGSNHSTVKVNVQFYKDGVPITASHGSQTLSVFASNVGGTSFKDNDSQWAMTQAT